MRRMSAAVVVVTASLALAGSAAHAAGGVHGKTAEKYRKLFDALWTTVHDSFYDPGFHGVDWDAVGARYRKQLVGVTGDEEFKVLATRMLAELGTSHLRIHPPQSSAAGGVGIGVRFRTINDQVLVSQIDPLSDARAAGLRPGDRLLSPRAALDGEPGTTARLKVEDCDGRVRRVAVKREGAFWPPQHPGFEWQRVTLAPGYTVGYVRIDRFDDGAAGLADRAMVELADTDGLILDVRGNSGGNLSAARLVSYFSGPSRIAVALFARGYLEKLGHPVSAADVEAAAQVSGVYTEQRILDAVREHHGGVAFLTENMGDKEYTRPVIVLIGGRTGSAAEGFAWMMHEFTKATLVGRRTAGALLSAERFDLPDGWKVTVPVQGLWGADGTDYRDRPVKPDVTVGWTRRDVCNGRDPDIERALALLSQQRAR